VEQSQTAVDAGAFHNDVVAVSNLDLLLCHAEAFTDLQGFGDDIRRCVPGARIIEVSDLSLTDTVSSYLFNSQLVSLPGGGMGLILPAEAAENPAAKRAVDQIVSRAGDIEHVEYVDVRESMRNGGGPACLRLRVPLSQAGLAGVHPGYILDLNRIERLERLVEAHWPKSVSPNDLQDPELWTHARGAEAALKAFIDQATSSGTPPTIRGLIQAGPHSSSCQRSNSSPGTSSWRWT